MTKLSWQLPSSSSTPTSSWSTYLPLLLVLLVLSFPSSSIWNPFNSLSRPPVPSFVQSGLLQCSAIITQHPQNLLTPFTLASRSTSDRFVPGTPAVLLVNATVWTGNNNGEEIFYSGSVLLDKGIVQYVGKDKKELKKAFKGETIDVGGKWVTPGLVDLHSHLGVGSSPSLKGSSDTNSVKNPILPYLRSIDGLNTHDDAFKLTASGGVTTALVLPGSANNIGGQAFVIKPRVTDDNLPTSMLVDPPFIISNGSLIKTGTWRHMKHAVGENIHGTYGSNRMDQSYNFRRAYLSASKVRDTQDAWCALGAANTAPFPEAGLEEEALVDVLRGKVKVNVHLYETVDFDMLIRLSNEFKFPIAACHHATEAFLVPDLIKKSWPGDGSHTPAVAAFATRARVKREASRGSEFWSVLLSEEGIPVVLKSDHPVLDSRYLVYEAAQSAYYGLNWTLALASVTTTPAKAMGMDHRLGSLREGFDADVVVWDSHPLALGATPTHTFIDGINVLPLAHSLVKPASAQKIPVSSPEFKEEAKRHREAHGEHDWLPAKKGVRDVMFTNVKSVFVRSPEDGSLVETTPPSLLEDQDGTYTVVVQNGTIVSLFPTSQAQQVVPEFESIDLDGGFLIPGLTTFGSAVGLEEIPYEPSTQDGFILDPYGSQTPEMLLGSLMKAVDGAVFGTKDQQISARYGVTKSITAPSSRFLISGLAFASSTSSIHPLSPNAILQPVTALHVTLSSSSSLSVSTQINILRRALLGKIKDVEGAWEDVRDGKIPLVINVDKADIVARVIALKREVGGALKVTISGGAEAWMLADELAAAEIGVILVPARAYPSTWDERRLLPGHPFTPKTPITVLLEAGVKVGLGVTTPPGSRNTLNEAMWAYLSSETLSVKEALALASTDLEELLGYKAGPEVRENDWVAVRGDVTSISARVVAAGDAEGGVNLF